MKKETKTASAQAIHIHHTLQDFYEAISLP